MTEVTFAQEVESKCKKISSFFSNVSEQLADPTSMRFLSNDSQAVEASRATSLSVALSVLFMIFSVLFIANFAPLMKQCKNFILCLTSINFKVNF